MILSAAVPVQPEGVAFRDCDHFVDALWREARSGWNAKKCGGMVPVKKTTSERMQGKRFNRHKDGHNQPCIWLAIIKGQPREQKSGKSEMGDKTWQQGSWHQKRS